MDLNIGFKSDEKFVASNLTLKPWGIYEVKFDGCEHSILKKKDDESVTYEVLKFKFKSDKGSYTETLFAPKPGDEKRGTKKNANGHEIPTPSSVENFKAMLGQLLTFIKPEILNKLAGKSVAFTTLAKLIVKETESVIGKTVYIKLIGNNKGLARSPYMLTIFEGNNEPSIVNNFISDNIDKLGFSNYELQQKEKAQTAKPTNMASVTSTDVPVAEDSSDLDLDLL